MPQSLAHIALIVRDYDEAIAWFTDKLGFTLVADEPQPEQNKPGAISAEVGSKIATSKRWVLVAPPGAGDSAATVLLPSAALSNDASHRLNLGAASPAPPRRNRPPSSATRRAGAFPLSQAIA